MLVDILSVFLLHSIFSYPVMFEVREIIKTEIDLAIVWAKYFYLSL